MSSRSSSFYPGVMILLVLGCEPPIEQPVPDFQVRYETEQLLVGTDFDEQLCSGSIALMSRHVTTLEAELGRALEVKLLAYLYPTAPEICRERRNEANACFIPPTAHGELALMGHELVHAYLAQLNAEPIPFFDEGLALAYEGTMTSGFGVQISPQLNKWYSELEWWEYQSSGHFMSWMLTRFGEAPVISMYEQSEFGMTTAEISETMQDTLGLSLAEIEMEYASGTKELFPARGAFACSAGERVDWSGDETVIDVNLDCDDTRALSRLFEEEPSQIWRRFSMMLPAGSYTVVVEGAHGVIQKCSDSPIDELELPLPPEPVIPEWDYHRDFQLFQFAGLPTLSAETSANLPLTAGLYTFWVGRPAEQSGGARVSITRQ